jgi:predicted permease
VLSFLHDCRNGWRWLRRAPAVSVVAVLILALGIAANTTLLSWVRGTLLDPIPGATGASELVSLLKGERSTSANPPFSYEDNRDLSRSNRSFSGLLAFHDAVMTLTGGDVPERVDGTMASANYFEVLGVRPVLGRGFLPSEDGAAGSAPVVVISHALWQNRFGGDPRVIGRTVQIHRHPYTVVGVAPAGFQGCRLGASSDLWVPLVMDPVITGWRRIEHRETDWLMLIGRLRPGHARQQAAQEMNLLMRQIVAQYPDAHRGPNEILVAPMWRAPFGATWTVLQGLSLVEGLAAVLLLLACANVANLLLARSVGRERELAIRMVHGASRWRLFRQLLTEGLVLALAGGTVGVLLASWTVRRLPDLIAPGEDLSVLRGHVDGGVLLVSLAISVLSSLAFGIMPALRAARSEPTAVLKDDSRSSSLGRGRSRLANGLVVVQLSLAYVLLVFAGLFSVSYQKSLSESPGFEREGTLLASVDLLPAGYSKGQGIRFYRDLLAKLEGMPGVQSATLANWVPLSGGKHTHKILPEGYVPRPHESLEVLRVNVGPRYFETLRIPLAAGRDFSRHDTEASLPTVIVNQALVDRFWPGKDPLGRRLETAGRSFTVVGVARNSKHSQMSEIAPPMIYLPLAQDFYHDATIHLRVSGDPLSYVTSLTQVCHDLDPDLPLFDIETLSQSTRRASAAARVTGAFVRLFGALALGIAAVGVFGVVAYSTGQRTREVGVRMAFGARSQDVYRLVMGRGLWLVLAGLGVGAALSLPLAHSVEGMLFGVRAWDWGIHGGVAAVLLTVTLAAVYLPARRAASVDPTVALRCD